MQLTSSGPGTGSPRPRARCWLLLVGAVLFAGCTAPAGQAMPASADVPGTSVTATPGATVGDSPTSTGPAPTSTPGSRSASSTTSKTASSTAPRSSAASSAACLKSCFVVGPTVSLPQGVAPGASGLVASTRDPGVFFVVDDLRGTSEIVAVRSDGSLAARIQVRGMSARNAEALTAGPCSAGGPRCLFIGDIGDNSASREDITVYRIAEPGLTAAGPIAAQAWTYAYPDGPHNAEAMVLAPDGSLVIITKSAPGASGSAPPPHRIYRGRPGGGRLVLVARFTPPDPPVRLQSLLTGTVVTDAAYAHGNLLLLTYDEVIEYQGPSPAADPAGFAGWPRRLLPAPPLIQSEGISWLPAGCGYAVVSENGPGGGRSALAVVRCRP